jgi:hypothetical protein
MRMKTATLIAIVGVAIATVANVVNLLAIASMPDFHVNWNFWLYPVQILGFDGGMLLFLAVLYSKQPSQDK